jgi:hypothetical protein
MSVRSVTVVSDHPNDAVPAAEGFVLILGHEYDADARPERGNAKPQPIPTLMFGGGKPSVVLLPEDEAAFRRVHKVLEAITGDRYPEDDEDTAVDADPAE